MQLHVTSDTRSSRFDLLDLISIDDLLYMHSENFTTTLATSHLKQSLPILVSSSVRILSFDMPEVARAGQSVPLFCNYDLEGANLFMVKWFKGTHEFYRYRPGESREPTKVFLVPNLNVDVSLIKYYSQIRLKLRERYFEYFCHCNRSKVEDKQMHYYIC